MTNQKKSLIDSGATLAAITGGLYSVSTAYYGGYFSTLQLDDNILDRNFHQSLYHGFVISFMPVFYVLFVYASARFLYSHMLLPEINDLLRHSLRRRRLFLKLKHKCLGKRKDSEIERYQKRHTFKAVLYAGIFTTLLFSLWYFESNGKKEGIVVLEKIESKAIQQSDLIMVKIEDKPMQLLPLICGARNCAGIEPNTKVVYYFPQNGHSYQLGVCRTYPFFKPPIL